jgi:hypothetical protein
LRDEASNACLIPFQLRKEIRAMRKNLLFLIAMLATVTALAAVRSEGEEQKTSLWVDAERGRPGASGTQEKPCGSLSEALDLLPDMLTHTVTIQVAAGDYSTTGGQHMPAERLELMRRMRPGVEVRIVGIHRNDRAVPRFAWEGGTAMVVATDGNWSIENIQIGTGTTRQRRGVMVSGPAQVALKDVKFRTRSQSDAAIYAERGGLVLLRGEIRINENMHQTAPDESFAGIIATDHGTVRFDGSENASLDMGNGSLSASYYGCIGLGCKTARITNWGDQTNTLAINNGGRIDLHNTTTTLVAKQKRNTPIGLEHDGHILAEGARIIIEGENEMAIALQKASTLTCNDIELRGTFGKSLWASSGSMFVGRFRTDVSDVEADTSAQINIEALDGKVRGAVTARRCAVVSLPDRSVFSK